MPYSEANSRLMLIDDRDPAVQYEGSWDREYNYFGNTFSVSTQPNASVSMEFDGTRIIVVALAVPPSENYTSPPTVQFAIDGTVAATVTPDAVDDWAFVALFDSQGLPDGMHTINATVRAASDAYPFLLDSFEFQPSKKYLGLALAPSTLDATGDGGDGDGEAGKATGKVRKTDVGAIVGGVLGGLALVALSVALFWWCRRRRQHAYTSIEAQEDEPKPASAKTITPFVATRPTSVASIESKHANCDPSRSSASSAPASLPSTSTVAASARPTSDAVAPWSPATDHSSTGATVASSSLAAPGADAVGAPPAHSMPGHGGLADATTAPAPARKARRPSMIDMVQAALQAARGRRSREDDPDATPTEAPPRYSERST